MRRSRDADYVPRDAYARYKTLGADGEGYESCHPTHSIITTDFKRGLRETENRRGDGAPRCKTREVDAPKDNWF